ncbi:uncharacterized protein C19orf44 homolog [Dipodomys merriami]
MASASKLRYGPGGMFDLSDLSLEDSKMEAVRNLPARPGLAQAGPGHSRFLRRNQSGAPPRAPGGRGRTSRPSPGAAARTSAVLAKLAQMESKLRGRRPAPAPARPGAHCRSSSEGLALQQARGNFQKKAGDTSSIATQSLGGSRFLKTRAPPARSAPPHPRAGTAGRARHTPSAEPAGRLDAPDSDEEEMKELLGSLTESSRREETWTKQSSAAREDGETPRGPTALALPSSEPLGPPGRAGSAHTPLPGGSAPPAASPPSRASSAPASSELRRLQLVSLSTRSEAGPWNAPASEAATDSPQDFRVNILSLEDLSLEDLAADVSGETSAGDWSEEGSGSGSGSGGPQASGSTFQAAASPVAGDESQVSERLGASVASEPPSESPSSLAYSENFERSLSPSVSEPAPSDTCGTPSELSCSQSAAPHAGPQPRPVKEVAVQTLEPLVPGLAYQWSRGAGEAVVGPGLGSAYLDPVPIASHVVSADALEALTAYSPAVLALNELLKQQLGLTRQFVEASRQLHSSFLRSLDGDAFHYHTLEDAQEYIRCHRPAPLTLDAALREVTEELRGPAGAPAAS